MNNQTTSQQTSARVAGFTFLFYIAAGISSLSLGAEAQGVELLYFLQSLLAFVLGVTLYEITRGQGPVLALLALTCRIAEGIGYGESEIFFALGSLFFCWLLLRGRLIPAWMAWLGVIASALLTVILPLQLVGVLAGTGWASSITWILWLPMLVFEVAGAFWMLVKGVSTGQGPTMMQSTP